MSRRIMPPLLPLAALAAVAALLALLGAQPAPADGPTRADLIRDAD